MPNTALGTGALSKFKIKALFFIAPAFSKVRYRGSTFRLFVRPSTICVESRKLTSSLGMNFISLQQW